MKRLSGILIFLILILSGAFASADEYDDNVMRFYSEVLEEEGKQKADENITRSEFLSVLMKQAGYTKDIYICSFYDVFEMNWDYVYIANAQDRDIAKGSDGGFGGTKNITAEEASAFLVRTFKNGIENDVKEITLECSEYSREYVSYCLGLGIYPHDGGRPLQADAELKTDKALRFIADLLRSGEGEKNSLRFSEGYPKMISTGRVNSVGLLIKTNKPCTVYYNISTSSQTDSVIPMLFL